MRVEVKICGMTNIDDARAAIAMGADYIGFVFYAKSPRHVSPAQVAGIVRELGSGVRAVGVFVNETREKALEIAGKCGLYAVQLHGDELPADFTAAPIPIWRAIKFFKNLWTPDPAAWNAERYLIDATVSGIYGGSGVKADWREAADLAGRVKVMLAGGLTPDNVSEAISAVRPAGVDVVSGVEAEPGKKDHGKMKSFIAAVEAKNLMLMTHNS